MEEDKAGKDMDEDGRTESKENGDSDMEPENESEEE